MAKLDQFIKKISVLKEQLSVCSQAYMDLLDKYNKLYQKYSYEETMERVKQVNEQRKNWKDIL